MSKPLYVQEYQAIVDVLNEYSEGGKQAPGHALIPRLT